MENWQLRMDETTRGFRDSFGGLDKAALNRKPTAATWSIAQNIDHLIVINSTYFPVISAIRENRYSVPWIGRIPGIPDFFGRVVLKSVQPDRRKRMKTFPLWEPSTSEIPGDIVQKFEQHQTILKEWMVNCKDLVDAGTVISSPANRYIVYKLSMAFDIITIHEQRHLVQAREVLKWMEERGVK